jgi:hypothetical protein
MTERARDIGLVVENRVGVLADLGETLGAAGVSLEGGGALVHAGRAIAHFLVDDGDRAAAALTARGLGPVAVSDVVTTRLDQDVPGQLGCFTRALADAGVDVLVQYSDHDHRLVLVVAPEHLDACRRTATAWDADRAGRTPPPG